jgi:hypothetical protein
MAGTVIDENIRSYASESSRSKAIGQLRRKGFDGFDTWNKNVQETNTPFFLMFYSTGTSVRAEVSPVTASLEQ